jgi:hypothetical protein
VGIGHDRNFEAESEKVGCDVGAVGRGLDREGDSDGRTGLGRLVGRLLGQVGAGERSGQSEEQGPT